MKQTLILLFSLFISVSALSQEVFTPETMWKLGRVSEPRVSPDGKTVLYSIRNFTLAGNSGITKIYTIPVEGGTPVQITDSADKASHARWFPDGKIAFLSSQRGTAQIHVMNADGSGKTSITNAPSDISAFGISNSGDRIWFAMEVKTQKSVADKYPDQPKTTARIYDDLMFRHWDHWEDEKNSHIFYTGYVDGKTTGPGIDIMNNEPYDSPLSPFGDEEHVAMNHDATKIAYTCKKYNGTAYAMGTNSDIYVYDVTTRKTENISQGMMGYDTKPAFSPDGKQVAWLSMETPMYEADRNRIFVYDFASKTKKDLTTGFDYTADSPVWSKDGSKIYFNAGINATDQVWVLDVKNPGAAGIKQITKDRADVTGFSVGYANDKPVMVTSVMSMSSPVELFSVNPETGASTQITFTNKAALSAVKMGKVEQRMVKATDGKDILTWVIYPPDFDPSKKYPALLYCQGGPQSTVSQFFSYRWNFQLMAANGYIIVAPNRRGLPSFGTEWNRAISGDWGGQAMKDLLSAIDDVSKEPYVNKEKLGAVGASFGGYSVYWLAGNHNKRFKAFISHCGVFNLESMYGTTEELFFADFDMAGSYMKRPLPKSYTEFNPIKFVNNWDTPILVIHNDKDFRVPISQGMEAFTAARLKGVPARFLSFADENHWITKPQNSIVWNREFFEWLDTYLK